ncbi:MAG: ankyrin repeat domain-containing protein [Flavobacteriales bacterium]|nr:ankyrin repeat domain-containing protein [Flavobacteriales bacterium]
MGSTEETCKTDMEYDSDLFEAVEFGNLNAVRTFWSEDIDMNYQDKKGWTLLMYAAYYGFTDIFEFLVEKGANVDVIDTENRTARSIALDNGNEHLLELISSTAT